MIRVCIKRFKIGFLLLLLISCQEKSFLHEIDNKLNSAREIEDIQRIVSENFNITNTDRFVMDVFRTGASFVYFYREDEKAIVQIDKNLYLFKVLNKKIEVDFFCPEIIYTANGNSLFLSIENYPYPFFEKESIIKLIIKYSINGETFTLRYNDSLGKDGTVEIEIKSFVQKKAEMDDIIISGIEVVGITILPEYTN